jgi:hypothetical protein
MKETANVFLLLLIRLIWKVCCYCMKKAPCWSSQHVFIPRTIIPLWFYRLFGFFACIIFLLEIYVSFKNFAILSSVDIHSRLLTVIFVVVLPMSWNQRMFCNFPDVLGHFWHALDQLKAFRSPCELKTKGPIIKKCCWTYSRGIKLQ